MDAIPSLGWDNGSLAFAVDDPKPTRTVQVNCGIVREILPATRMFVEECHPGLFESAPTVITHYVSIMVCEGTQGRMYPVFSCVEIWHGRTTKKHRAQKIVDVKPWCWPVPFNIEEIRADLVALQQWQPGSGFELVCLVDNDDGQERMTAQRVSVVDRGKLKIYFNGAGESDIIDVPETIPADLCRVFEEIMAAPQGYWNGRKKEPNIGRHVCKIPPPNEWGR